MIKRLSIKPEKVFERAVIGGTYIDENKEIYLVSLIEGEEVINKNEFILTNLSRAISTVYDDISEVTDMLKTLEAKIIDIDLLQSEDYIKYEDIDINTTIGIDDKDSPIQDYLHD